VKFFLDTSVLVESCLFNNPQFHAADADEATSPTSQRTGAGLLSCRNR
jgi:hypothetical protein